MHYLLHVVKATSVAACTTVYFDTVLFLSIFLTRLWVASELSGIKNVQYQGFSIGEQPSFQTIL